MGAEIRPMMAIATMTSSSEKPAVLSFPIFFMPCLSQWVS